MNKRILSLLLACVLCAGTMPAAVSAEEAERILLPGELISEAAVPEEEQAARIYYAGEETPAEDGAVTFHPYVFEIEGSEVRASVQLEPGLMGSGKDVSESTPDIELGSGSNGSTIVLITNNTQTNPINITNLNTNVTEPVNETITVKPPKLLTASISGNDIYAHYISNYPGATLFETYAFTTNITLAMNNQSEILDGKTVYMRAIASADETHGATVSTTLNNTYVTIDTQLNFASVPDPKPGETLYIVVEDVGSSGKSGYSNPLKVTVPGGDNLTNEELIALIPQNLKVKQLNATTTAVSLSSSWTKQTEIDTYDIDTYVLFNSTKVMLKSQYPLQNLQPAGPGVSPDQTYQTNNNTCVYEPIKLSVLQDSDEQFYYDTNTGMPDIAYGVKNGDTVVITLSGVIPRTSQRTPPAVQQIVIQLDSQPESKKETKLTAKDATVKAGTDATYTVALNDNDGAAVNNANLTLSIIDKTYDAVTGSDGKALFSIGKLDADTYNINVEFKGNDLYEPCNATATISVEKTETKLTAENASIKAGTDATYTVTLNDNDGAAVNNANLTLSIIDKTYDAVTGSDGKAQFSIGKRDAGIYEAKVEFKGNDLYEPCNATATITAEKTQASISASDATFKAGQAVTFNATLTEAGGSAVSGAGLSLTIAGSDTAVNANTNENGVALFNLGELPAGVHQVTVSFAENNLYLPCNKTASITVVKTATSISATDASFIAGQTINYTATLNDADGNAVSGTELTLIIADSSTAVKATTSENGVALFSLGLLPAGIHTVTISFEGNNLYSPCNATANINVTTAPVQTVITAQNAAFTAGQEINYTVTLTDSSGHAIHNAGLNLTMVENSLTRNAATDENGIATFGLGALDAGIYQTIISFPGNDQYLPCNATVSIEVGKAETTITATDTSFFADEQSYQYDATLADSGKNAICNASLVLTVNGQQYTAITNNEGVASFRIKKLNVGSYQIEIKYEGDSQYLASNKSFKINIVKGSTKILAKNKLFKVKVKNKKFTITLKDRKGKPIKGKKVTLKIKGKTYTAKTNSKGKATFNIKKLNKKGKYTATIRFKGDSIYNSCSKKVKITIK